MHAVIVEFSIQPAHAEAFAAAIADNARASRETEPGCRQFDVCRLAGDGTRFMLYELYDDEAAFDAHLATAHFQAMNARTADWVVAKTLWRGTRFSPR